MAKKMKTGKVKLVILGVASLWVIFGVNLLFHLHLNRLGIVPRTTKGLVGIIAAPFLHANLVHLISNTIPLLVLSLLLVIFYEKIAPAVVSLIVIVGGGLVWLLARQANHIGASGLIYGLAAFLIVYGIIKKNLVSIILSVLVAVIYGSSMLSGLLPTYRFVSWESHLFGAAAGVLAAYAHKNRH
jgi:membrane associated rhomboid family serine protease